MIDLSFAEEVAAGDAAFMEKLLRTFLRNVASLRTELDVAVAEASDVRVRRVSHGMKGVFQTMGATPAAEAALRVEKSSHESVRDLAPELAALAAACDHVERAVRGTLVDRFAAGDLEKAG